MPKNYILFIMVQVMSESVASALEFVDNDATQQTRLFIRMIDRFFDLLNMKGPQVAKLKRKDSLAPYTRPSDEQFKVSIYICVCYLHVLLLNHGMGLLKEHALIGIGVSSHTV